jgi:hypothetical protein
MLAAGLVLCLACLVAARGYAGGAPPRATPPPGAGAGWRAHGRPVSARVTVTGTARMAMLPRSYLGLSTEYWALPQWAGEMPLLERVMSLIHVPGDGPLVLRVGGDSADHSFWDPHENALPSWAFSLAPRWLAQARALVRRLGVRLILDLNLITDTPAAAAVWARAAKDGLPRGSIRAFEVGNEPDIYTRSAWLAITAGRPAEGRPLPAAMTAGGYVRDFRAYAEALELAAPHTLLAGPALANPVSHRRWTTALIAGARRSLGLVTIHRYPYSACTRRHPAAAPTVAKLLGPGASSAMADALRPTVDEAHDAGLPVRMTELNSVTCGGRPGVSNTFATALWAPDAFLDLARAGLDGINLHVRADTINAPFAITTAGLTARPLLYGMILFAHTLGPGARLVALRSTAPARLDFHPWAVRVGPDTLHVLLVDKGPRSVRAVLRLPATGAAGVQRMLAPAAGSETRVTLGGRELGPDGRWHGPAADATLAPRDGRYVVTVRGFSAVLLSVRVAPGSLGAR